MFKLNPIKNSIKYKLYEFGLIGSLHRFINRNNLTVVMFHRVLSMQDDRWKGCDLDWTISDNIFDQCLIFLKEYYNIINISDLVESCDKSIPLPNRSLLITLDDGWADNEEYALPILKKYNVPAVVFIVSGMVDKKNPFWQEHIYASWKTNQIPADLVTYLCNTFKISELDCEKELKSLISEISNLPEIKKKAVVEQIMALLPDSPYRQMLNSSQVDSLLNANIDIGSHGTTHSPLVFVQNSEEELCLSKKSIEKFLIRAGKTCENICLSFPHGSYNEKIIEQSFNSGYKFLFTSDPYLVPLSSGKLTNKILGRVSIPQQAIVDKKGDFSESQLAFWLMNRPKKRL